MNQGRNINQGARSVYVESAGKVTIKSGNSKPEKILGIMPINPEVFIGREQALEDIRKRLTRGVGALLLVNGEGGIGKTTLASSYFHRYLDTYRHLAWILADGGIENALLKLGGALNVEFDPQASGEEHVDTVIKRLAALDKPCLLVIDNANNLDDLEKTYPRLRQCTNLHLLLTTRLGKFAQAATYPVTPLNADKARDLFFRYFPSHDVKEDELLKKIFRAIGYNTLVIELLAKNLNNFNNELARNYTLQEMLDDLKDKGLLQLSKSGEVLTDYGRKKAKTEDIVTAMYDLSTISKEERSLLVNLSVLPPQNIPFRHLEQLLEKQDLLDKQLLSLYQKGWIDFNRETKSFKCNPLVQEIVRVKETGGMEAAIEKLAQEIVDILDYDSNTGTLEKTSYEEALWYAAYGESLVRYNTRKDEHISLLFDRLGSFYRYYGQLDKALDYFQQETILFVELYESHPNNVGFKNGLAISYEKLGETLSALGQLDKALDYFQQETILFVELYESHPNNVGFKNGLAISYSKLGETLSALGQLDKALDYFQQRSQLGKELYESHPNNVGFKNGLAISYIKLAMFYENNSNERVKARQYFRLAEEHWEELTQLFPAYVEFQRNLNWVKQKLG